MKKRISGLAKAYAILLELADEPDEEKNTGVSMDSQTSDATIKQNSTDVDKKSR